MRRSSVPRGTLLAWLLLGFAAQAAAGQVPPIHRDHADSEAFSTSCAVQAEESDPFLAEINRARALESEEAVKAALAALEPEARRLAEQSPNDVVAQTRLAAVMGAGLDFEHGRTKMAGASELRHQALRVLELDPEHAGASYMLGRIHASVLRLGRLKRF